MDEQLKGLRKAMNNTVFHKKNFGEHQKAVVRLSVNKKRKVNFAPAIIIILFLSVSSILGLSYMNDKQSADYITAKHDLEEQHFVNQRHSQHTLHFYNNELTISTNPYYTNPPDSTVYKNISVKTEEDQYFVYSGKEHLMTLQKIAPRLVKDEDGNVFSTQKYLSNLLSIEVVNESDVKLKSIEFLVMNGEEFEGTLISKQVSKFPLTTKVEVERSEFHRKVEFQVIVTLADGGKHTLNQTIFLDGAYEDLYLFHIVGTTVENLTIETK